MIRLATGVILLSLALPAPAFAEASAGKAEASIVGTWRLQSVEREVIATGKRAKEFGDKPDGYMSYLPDGRMHAILVIDDRMRPGVPAQAKDDKTKIGTTIGYAGSYSAEGGKIVTRIEFASDAKMTGTEQERFYKIDGDTLTLTTAASKNPKDGQEVRTVAVWKKVAGR